MDTGTETHETHETNSAACSEPNAHLPVNIARRIYVWDGEKFVLETIENRLEEFVGS